MIDPRIEPSAPFTDDQLAAIERGLSWKLPEDYKAFVRTYGGAFVGGSIDGDERLSVLAFASADQALRNIVLLDEYVAEGCFPFASCEGNGLYLLDRHGAVIYTVKWGAERITLRVAGGFG